MNTDTSPVQRAIVAWASWFFEESADRSFEHRVDASVGEVPSETSTSRIVKLDEAMALHIQNALEVAMGKVNGSEGAAALLGIHPNTLRNRMKKLRISYGRMKKGRRPRK